MRDDQNELSLCDPNSRNCCRIGDSYSIIDAFSVHFSAVREIFFIFARYYEEDFDLV
jgi:hypothetical protein